MYDRRPHSRACGIWPHDHGVRCHANCPSCAGRPLAPPLEALPPTEPVDRTRFRELLAEAVPTPWEVYVNFHDEVFAVADGHVVLKAPTGWDPAAYGRSNVKLAVAAVNALPELLEPEKIELLVSYCPECRAPGDTDPLIEQHLFDDKRSALGWVGREGWLQGRSWEPHPAGGEQIITGQGSVWMRRYRG